MLCCATRCTAWSAGPYSFLRYGVKAGDLQWYYQLVNFTTRAWYQVQAAALPAWYQVQAAAGSGVVH